MDPQTGIAPVREPINWQEDVGDVYLYRPPTEGYPKSSPQFQDLTKSQVYQVWQFMVDELEGGEEVAKATSQHFWTHHDVRMLQWGLPLWPEMQGTTTRAQRREMRTEKYVRGGPGSKC